MANILLCEINRMKEIMGLSLLSEGIDDLVKKLLGYSDESAQSIAKSADEAGSEFSTALKQIVGGAGTYDDLLSYVSKQGGSVKSVDDIVSFVKSQPELLKKIATSSDAIMKDAAQSIIKKSSITTLLEKDLIENIEGIILYTVDESDAAMMSKMIDDTLVILNRYSSNADVSDLIKKLKDKKSVVNNMKSTPSVKVTDNLGGVSKIGDEYGVVKAEVKTSDEILSDINTLFKDEPEIIDALSKIPKQDLEDGYKAISELPESKIDEIFEKVKESCGLKEAANNDKWGKFCSGASKYTKEADSGVGRIMKRILILAGAGIGIYLIIQYLRGEKITIPVPDVEFSNTPEFTVSECNQWLTQNDYDAIAKSTTKTDDTRCDCTWETPDGSDSGTITFIYTGDKWIKQ